MRLLLNGVEMYPPPCPTGALCPYAVWRKYVERIIPTDWKAECSDIPKLVYGAHHHEHVCTAELPVAEFSFRAKGECD